MKLKKLCSVASAIVISTTFIGGAIEKGQYISYGMEHEVKNVVKPPSLMTPLQYEKYTKVIIDADQDVDGAEIGFYALYTWNHIKKINGQWKEINKDQKDWKLLSEEDRRETNYNLVKVEKLDDHTVIYFEYIANTPEKEKIKYDNINDENMVNYKTKDGVKSETKTYNVNNTLNNVINLKGSNFEVANKKELTESEIKNIKETLKKINKNNNLAENIIEDIVVNSDLTKNDAIIVKFSDKSIEFNPKSILDLITEKKNTGVGHSELGENTVAPTVKSEVENNSTTSIKKDDSLNKKPHKKNTKPANISVRKIINNAVNNTTVNNKHELGYVENTIQGGNNIELSINASKFLYKNGSSNVIIVNKEKLSDVLTAIPFATRNSSPILYTDGKTINKNVFDEIKRLGSKNITIIGGEKSVSKEVSHILNRAGYSVKRIGGRDRYETNQLLNKGVSFKGNQVAIVSGEDFPDALAVSYYVTKNDIPVVLVKKDSISSEAKNYIRSIKNASIKIFGGKKSVSDYLAKELTKNNASVDRISGRDRYETSEIISDKLGYDNGVVISTGSDAEKTLIASMVSSKMNKPLTLVKEMNGKIMNKKIENVKKIVIK